MEITLLGAGLLGGAIGERLLRCGHRLTVWNRSPARCTPLVALGAEAAATPAAAVAAGELVITVLSDGPTTAAVLRDQAGEALAGRLVLQVATIAPQQSQALAAALAERGASYLEVPVLGSRPEALAGNLQLMVGGDAADLARARPLLADLGGDAHHLGPVGAALTTKLALNQLIASLTHSFSLSLHLVQRAGVDVEAFLAILRASTLHAPTFDKKLARELADDYADPNFPTAHLRKDLLLFLQAADQAGLNSEGLGGLAQLLERATAAGLDDLDYCALHRLTGSQAGSAAAAAADLPPLRLPPGLRLSPEQFALVCDANPEAVLELATDGRLIAMTPTGGDTSARNCLLITRLQIWALAQGGWKVFDSSGGFRLPDGSVLSPDAAVVRLERWQALSPEQRRGFPPLCPDLVIELVSPSDAGPRGETALRQKMAAYLANGAQLGWLLFPDQQAVELWRPPVDPASAATPERLEPAALLEGGELLPGLQLELAELWAV